MSNHNGSYILNGVLQIAKEVGIFETIGEEKSREFILKIVKLGRGNDCNVGEILEDIGEELGICYCCLGESDNIEDGICIDCR